MEILLSPILLSPILLCSTHPRWFAKSSADVPTLMSDHLHCERKAAENALSLVRRDPHRGTSIAQLSRLAHEETSHVVQVAALLALRAGAARGGARTRAGAAARLPAGSGVHRGALARAAHLAGPGLHRAGGHG